jgi:hypothetical protein
VKAPASICPLGPAPNLQFQSRWTSLFPAPNERSDSPPVNSLKFMAEVIFLGYLVLIRGTLVIDVSAFQRQLGLALLRLLRRLRPLPSLNQGLHRPL